MDIKLKLFLRVNYILFKVTAPIVFFCVLAFNRNNISDDADMYGARGLKVALVCIPIAPAGDT